MLTVREGVTFRPSDDGEQMAFIKKTTKDYFLLDTPVENIFINEYMTMAPGEYVKVYLFAFMYAGLKSNISNEDVAKHMEMDIEDVLKAWTFWEKLGVIRKRMKEPDNILDYDVEFVMLKEKLYGKSKAEKHYGQDSAEDMGLGDAEIKKMFETIEHTQGKMLNSGEMQAIMSWIRDYHVTAGLIAYGFEHAASKKKTGLRYVESIVKSWAVDGFKTAEEVQEKLAEKDKRQKMYRRIFKALGFSRNATEEEKRIINSWFEELNCTLDIILDACSKTSGIANPNINYVNKVLQNWHDEGRKIKDETGLAMGEIMKYLEDLRAYNEEKAETRRREVYRKVPRIKEIEDEIKLAGAEMSKVIISGRDDKKDAADDIKAKVERLNTERAFLMTDNGFTPDYMDIRYSCPECRDTGLLETGEKCQCLGEVTKEKIRLLKTKKNR